MAPQLGVLLWLLAGTVTGSARSAPDPRAQAGALLAELARDPDSQRVASDLLAKVKDALRRADQQRASGDQKRAALSEQTALEWAATAQLLVKTAKSEKALAEAQAHITELETKIFRAQTLVEQTVARRARAEETVRKLDEKGVKP